MQRLAILEFLETTHDHPTADEVFRAVRETCPTIARATVYNTLEALICAGAIHRLTIDPNVSRYDADVKSHMHFRCRICRRVYDLPLEEADDRVRRVDGHKIETVRTYAYGVCSDCLNNDAADGAGARGDVSEDENPSSSPPSRIDGREAHRA